MRLNDTAAGILVALGAVLLINFPLWRGIVLNGELGRADIVTESSDEEFYLTRIREVADGHFWTGQPYVYERRDQRYPLGNLWEAALGTAMRVTGAGIKTVSTLADAVFPFLLVLLLWTAVRPVLPEKRWRLTLIAVLFLGSEMHWWMRPVSPQATMVLPLLYLWALFAPARHTLRLTALRGALIGLMVHSYPFHWTYCLVAEGLFTAHMSVRMRSAADAARRGAAVVLPFIVIASPWILSTLAMHGNVEYAQTMARLGMLERRLPAGLPLQALIVLAGMAVLWFRRNTADKRIPDILLTLLLAGLVVLNQMLVTGKEAEFSSHYRQILFFPLWITVFWSLRALIGNARVLAAAVTAGFLVVIGVQTVTALQAHEIVFSEHAGATGERDARMERMRILNALPDEQVILTDFATSRDLTIYTRHYPFLAEEARMYLLDDASLRERAKTYQAVFPDQPLSPRVVAGTSYLNRALYERTLCLLHGLLRFERAACDVSAESYLPPEWRTFRTDIPPPAENIAVLRDAHVSYTLLKDIPAWLEPYGTKQAAVGDYTLLRLDWSRP